MPGRALIITGVAMWLATALALTVIVTLAGWYWIIDSVDGALAIVGLNLGGVVLFVNGVRERRQVMAKRVAPGATT